MAIISKNTNTLKNRNCSRSIDRAERTSVFEGKPMRLMMTRSNRKKHNWMHLDSLWKEQLQNLFYYLYNAKWGKVAEKIFQKVVLRRKDLDLLAKVAFFDDLITGYLVVSSQHRCPCDSFQAKIISYISYYYRKLITIIHEAFHRSWHTNQKVDKSFSTSTHFKIKREKSKNIWKSKSRKKAMY